MLGCGHCFINMKREKTCIKTSLGWLLFHLTRRRRKNTVFPIILFYEAIYHKTDYSDGGEFCISLDSVNLQEVEEDYDGTGMRVEFGIGFRAVLMATSI